MGGDTHNRRPLAGQVFGFDVSDRSRRLIVGQDGHGNVHQDNGRLTLPSNAF
jgi:hypothetical protein